ncbi:MAG TPA: DUF6259 domain-containing protein [Planctomycetota bacterium]|nr:DUF6259 domain-containing protein [Planctomycetota bacterium]
MTANTEAICFSLLGCALGLFMLAATVKADDVLLFHHDWYVAGPFLNTNRSGFATEYPPEKGVDLGATYKGADGIDVRWRRILREGEPTSQPGPVNLHKQFWVTTNVCAYAYTTIESDRPRPATILAGSDDTITVWLNGRKVLAKDVYRAAVPDSDEANVSLKQGRNEILVKVCQGSGAWEFFFRIVEPDPALLEKRYTLENPSVRLVFDYLGRLVELHNKETQRPCINGTEGFIPAPAFIVDAYSAHQRIYIDDPLLAGGGGFSRADPAALLGTMETGDLRRLDASPWHPPAMTIETKDGVQTLTCRTALRGDVRVEFTVSLPAAGGTSRWQIRVDNHADTLPRQHLRVYRVAFPILSGLCIANRPEENFLARPYIQGELIPNPSAYAFERPGRPGARINVLTYPGWASMPWMDLYQAPPNDPAKASGLYFASYDPRFQQVDIETVPDAKARTISMAMCTLAFLEPGENWQSQTFIVGLHRGDWHWAGERYREDSKAWLTKRNVPDWIKEADGWLGTGGPNYRYADLPKMLEDARWLGLNYLQCWSEMLENVGPNKARKSYYCFFLPDPDRGGEKEMAEGVRKVREMGGHIGFYSNFWTFDADIHRGLAQWKEQIPPDVKIPDWHAEFKKYASVFPDGHIEPGSYDDGYAGMCPGAEGWRNYLKFWIVDKYVKQYGVDAWYLDSFPVTMFGSDRVCFSPYHGNGRPHGVGQGLIEFGRMIHEAAADTVKLAVTSESAGDVFMQYNSHALGIELVGGLTQYPKPEIYTCTFPDHIFFSGTCNNQLGLVHYYPELEKPTREVGMKRVFLMGYRFDILGYPVNRADAYMLFLRDLIALRQKIKGELYASSFKDDIGLGTLPEQVEAKVFRRNDGRSLTLTILDRRPKKSAMELSIDPGALHVGRPDGAALHTLDGAQADIKITQRLGKLFLPLPELKADPAAVVIRCAGPVP